MKTSQNIQDQFRFFVETLADGDYKVEDGGPGAYDLHRDSTYITVKDGKIKHIYEDIYCGTGVEGECYRNHRDGRRAAYPKRLQNAQDVSEQWEEIAAQWTHCVPSDGW